MKKKGNLIAIHLGFWLQKIGTSCVVVAYAAKKGKGHGEKSDGSRRYVTRFM